MKTGTAGDKKRFLLGILLTSLIIVSASFAYAWQPIAAFTQATLEDLQAGFYLPIVLHNKNISEPIPSSGEYVVVGWNDLGMHCYNRSFADLAVLPPFNTLWAQVILRGDPPQIITDSVSVSFSFRDNTYSVGKTDFWDYDLALFGVDLPSDIGLTGTGLSGLMVPEGDHFVAEGIPLTEYNDGDHNTSMPYQLADLVVRDSNGVELARNLVVAPVSSEMRCDECHSDYGIGNEDIATGVVEQNILTKHDEENMDEYPSGHEGALMSRRPILCAECHATNALGAPDVADLPNLSNAMHDKHKEGVSNTTSGCYKCHPGPQTQCLRDVMSSVYDMQCIDCHGTMEQVSKNTNPWLNEPRCDTCHSEPGYEQDQALYRMSKGHGGLYCEACHDSTHAIAPSTQPEDAIKFINLQGHTGVLDTCTVCHMTDPSEDGPHK
jgi:hypothetical protein